METYILSPILSTALSMLLFFGCYELGYNLLRATSLNKIISQISCLKYQYATIGILFLLLILFPLVSFLDFASIILKTTGYILILLGTVCFAKIFLSKRKINFFYEDKYIYIFSAFIILYFLLALSPLTAADVLDYHAGTALNILRFDNYKLFPEWFTGLQAGSGEVLIALGFAVGSEQFGSLVQFSSILSCSGIIIEFSKKNKVNFSNFFLAIIIITCPILIFLLSGNKPQAFFSSLIFLALAINFIKLKTENQFILAFFFINILICSAVIGKFSFNLSGFLVWLFTFFNFYKKERLFKLIMIPIIVFLFIYLPFLFWKFQNLGGNIIDYIFSPFPLHLPGYESFLSHNKGSQEIPFPFFLFYTTASRITEFLGFNIVLFLILLLNFKENKNIKYIIFISLIFVAISNIYASPSARYYLDIILWITLGITFCKKIKFGIFLKTIFNLQFILIFGILIYSNFIFLPGAFLEKNYLEIKNKYAYLYSGFDWINNSIPKNSNVIIINRPISQYKEFSVSGGFNYFTNKQEAIYYKNLLKKYNLEYLVYFGNSPDLFHLENCVEKIFLKKENVGYHATRNPFNKGSSYNGYIFIFNSSKLPDC